MSQGQRRQLIEDAKEILLWNEKTASLAEQQLFMLYDEAAAKTENSIRALYSKFADDNGLSMADAKKYLSGNEYNRWRFSIEQYIAKLPKEAKGSKTLLELNTLAMKSRISQQEQLLGNLYRNMMDLAGASSEMLTDALSDIIRTNYLHSCYSVQKNIQLGFNISRINEKRVLGMLRANWAERPYSKNLWGKTDILAAQAKREITAGMVEGSSVDKIAKELRALVDADKRKYVTRLVRTECKHFACQGELEGYKENGITHYRFIGGTEGSAHCDCAYYNGKVFEVDKAGDANNPMPPIHPNCLCTVVASFERSMFEDRKDVTPLHENVDFKKWAEKYAV